MKKHLIALLLACGSAHADTVATSKNEAGGMMVITDVPCKGENGWYAYASARGSSTLFGCWWSDQTMVHIAWNDGDVRSYPLAVWEVDMDTVKRMAEKYKGKGI
jgi:hypothetical protein